MTASSTATLETTAQPILLELDEQSWEQKLDRIERWLDNVLLLQASMRELAESVRDKVHEPHFRSFIAEVAEKAAQHERQAEQLYELIGRRPSRFRRQSGVLMGKTRGLWADMVGLAGGAAAPLGDLQQLLIASLNASSAFGTAEQLGLAMGIKELAETSFRIVAEKYAHHLLLQELTLESAATAILYDTELAEPSEKRARPMNLRSNGRLMPLALGSLAGVAALALFGRSRWRR